MDCVLQDVTVEQSVWNWEYLASILALLIGRIPLNSTRKFWTLPITYDYAEYGRKKADGIKRNSLMGL